MKWNDVYILLLANDAGSEALVNDIKSRYNVPSASCFCEFRHVSGTTPTYPNCLNKLTEQSKLIICGHSNSVKIGTKSNKDWSAQELACLLNQLGLKKAGLISFKACSIGADTFLEDFLHAVDQYDIKIAWLLGYRHIMGYFSGRTTSGYTEFIVRTLSCGLIEKFSDPNRIKVIKGNIDAYPSTPSTRFSTP